MSRRKMQKNNRILLIFGVAFAVFLSVYSIRNAAVSVVALEQMARCGAEEHVHDAECHTDGRLTCGKMEHTHHRNCYLILLKDNDINHLLSQIDTDKNNSLESVIHRTVDQALQYDKHLIIQQKESGFQYLSFSASAVMYNSSGTDINASNLDILGLNKTIAANGIEPGIVFNEDLYQANVVESGPQDTALLGASMLTAEQDNGGISTFALGAAANTNNNRSNIYVYLDNSWQCIGAITHTRSGNYSSGYTARVNTADLVNLINNSLGTSLTYQMIQVQASNGLTGTYSSGNVESQYTTLGTYSRQDANRAKYVRVMADTAGNPLEFYTVTFNYLDGSTTTQYVLDGTTITLPGDNIIWLKGTEQIQSGQRITITGTTVFKEKTDGLLVDYDIAFPTVTDVRVTVATEPTLQGATVQEITDKIPEGSPTIVRNVSQQEVLAKVNDHSAKMSRVIRFSGWKVGDTDTIVSANATLTWEELLAYSNSGRVTLTAVWEYRAVQTASFYVRYDSIAMDTTGNQVEGVVTDYTPELFATFVGGADAASMNYSQLNQKYYIADTSSDNSFGADQAIRARYGEQEGIWLQSFPDDDDIFNQLKQYADQLEVDGEKVDVDDLHSNAYTIRWYVMKCQSDAWHIDGRLVKKEGVINVTKTFAGNREGITLAKQDFRITAANASGSKRHTLNLSNYSSYDTETDTYTWKITGVEYGELWTMTESTYRKKASGEVTYNGYAAYNVVDAFYLPNNKNGDDSDEDGVLSVDVVGQTYAMDGYEVEVLRVEFTNVYHTVDSIIIKKEDAKTGNPIGGAAFQLLQNGSVLHFRYDSATDQFVYDSEGQITELAGSSTGYYEIVTTGFSYDYGDVTVKELQAPEGYTPIENIIVGQRSGDVGIINPSSMTSYHDGLLIVKNSTENTSVTAAKEWRCPESEWKTVTVQLMANGNPASALIPGVETAAQLSASNGWSYTWSNLPTHANGAEIVWSIRETQIGSESCRPDNTFANWLVFYGYPTYTRDDNGKITNTSITVQNDTRRTLLHLTKMDTSGNHRIDGVTFKLEHLIESGGGYRENPDFVPRTMTTGADGTLTFDNLLYGRYRLTEVSVPGGYEKLETPVYLTLHENGLVVVEDHDYASAGSTAYSIVVYNRMSPMLPATGGCGTYWYYTIGGLLMLAAVCGYMLPKRKKGGRQSA